MKRPDDVQRRIGLRHAVAVTAMVLGWATFLGVGFWEALTFDPTQGQFAPSWVNFCLIGSIGMAVSGGASASRLSLGRTIIDTFKAGIGIITGQDLDEHNDKEKH